MGTFGAVFAGTINALKGNRRFCRKANLIIGRIEMAKIALLLMAILLPAVVAAAELKGTILKVDKAHNRIVLKTERGEETLETTKTTKGVEHAKEGARVVVIFSEKDGAPKISEIAPGS